jgi:murein L,D-transpeptidase YafK
MVMNANVAMLIRFFRFAVLCVLLPVNADAKLQGARTIDREALSETTLEEGMPGGVVFMDESLPQILWVDLENGSMYRLKQTEQGKFAQPESIPISLGKAGYHKRREGDLRTPIGVYHVTSYLQDRQLDSKYGDGAFPFNYPSAFDRLQSRTGSGIWLHGLPKGVESRPLLDSDGCVVVDNQSLGLLKPLIQPGETMVVLAEGIEWWEERPKKYGELLTTIERWETDWESLDSDRYLSHYASEFTDFRRNLAEFKTYKKRVNGNKQWIGVDMSRMSALAHPEHEKLVSVRYYLTYRSSNYSWQGWKQMLWEYKDDGQWRIIYEGN